MYRYEVTSAVKADIESVVGRPIFYHEEDKFYINGDRRDVSIQYHHAATDTFKSETLDQICQELYSSDFSSNSTQTTLATVEHVVVDNEIAVDKGIHSFDTLISHDWTDKTTWSALDNSEWLVEPSASTKRILLTKAEVQFTHDVKIQTMTPPREFYFDIWVYNPLFDVGQAPTADDPDFMPGVSSGNPLRFKYQRYTYASLRDVFNFGNDHFTMGYAVDGMTAGITTVQFNYDQHVELRGDQGAQARFSMKDNLEMGGDFCTVSVVVREDDL